MGIYLSTGLWRLPIRRETTGTRTPPPVSAGASMLVGRGGVEPPTFHFSGGRSYQLSYLPERVETLQEQWRRFRTVGSSIGRSALAGPGSRLYPEACCPAPIV